MDRKSRPPLRSHTNSALFSTFTYRQDHPLPLFVLFLLFGPLLLLLSSPPLASLLVFSSSPLGPLRLLESSPSPLFCGTKKTNGNGDSGTTSFALRNNIVCITRTLRHAEFRASKERSKTPGTKGVPARSVPFRRSRRAKWRYLGRMPQLNASGLRFLLHGRWNSCNAALARRQQSEASRSCAMVRECYLGIMGKRCFYHNCCQEHIIFLPNVERSPIHTCT